jgi:hypothetical protein
VDDSSSLLNVSQIAALAEVGVSAVSNWRRRFEDFPSPVEAVPGGRDLFELGEVERWLEKHDRLKRADRSKRLLFQAADLLRSWLSDTSMTEALGAALALVAVGYRQLGPSIELRDLEAALASDPALEDLFRPLGEIDRHQAGLVLDLVLEIEQADLPDCFEWLLARHDQRQGFAIRASGDAQTALLVAMVGGEGEVIYDPAAGSGGFLTSLWRAAERKPRLFGQEVSAATSRIARQRFVVHGIPVSMADGDTLVDDAWPELRADVVVCDPPYQAKKTWQAGADLDPRWTLGPLPPTTDFAWLQQALHHLAENGRAYVFLPPGSLFRGGREGGLRRALLESGAVEAVVSLPPRIALNTGIPLALWILRRPEGDDERDSVLLVDASRVAPANRVAFAEELVPRIAAVLRGWRRGAEILDRDRELAAAVPVSDLLEGDATLVPARWIHQELSEAQRGELEGDFQGTLTGMDEIRRALGSRAEIVLPSGQSSAEWVPVRRLLDDGLVQIVKGTHVKKEDCLPRGVPVLRTRDVAAGLGEPVEPCHIAPDAAPPPESRTKPGDVVLSPASGALRAIVDRDGGRILARPLQALRLLDGSLDPEVVAAFLESPRNRRFVTGAAYARVSLRDLELPMLAERDSAALRIALEDLGDQERLANELASSAQELRHTLVSLASPPISGRG